MASSTGGRGGFAPRRGRGRGGRTIFTKTRVVAKPDLDKHPLGDLVDEIRSLDLSLCPDRQVLIHGCQYVTSYNWLSGEEPTIIIPGMPPQWTPPKSAQRLKEDSGQYFRDPNAAKFPDYPMAPVVHAVAEAQPSFDTANTDVFACGSTLGNLLRFARGIDKAFRFDVEVIDDTVFFVRKENDPKEIIQDVRGFGHTFPEAYTIWEASVKGSETHQRVIGYRFAGLKCLVRFESDGYIRETPATRLDTMTTTTDNDDDLLHALQGATITQPLSTSIIKPNIIKIKHGGSVISQQSIFDLKTRSGKHKRDIDMSDIYPALWIKQIPNFIVAYHDGAGLFEDIRVENVEKDVQTWARDNRNGIGRFASLLDTIIEIARGDPSRLLEVYCPGSDCLEIRKQFSDGVHALPTDLVVRWEEVNRGADSAYEDTSGGYEYSKGGVGLVEKFDYDSDFDDGTSEPDYTACSAHDCGYCGKCTY